LVWVALSDPGGAYAEAAAVLAEELGQGGLRPELRVAPWQELPGAPARPPQLIVSIGAAAFRGMTELVQRESSLARTPVIAALLPRASYEALAPRGKTATTAVLLDQPLPRYLDLLRLAMPERRKIGVLLGPESSPLAAPLAKAATARGLQLVTAQVAADQQDLYPALRTVLGDAEVLLALPDARIYNAGSLQNILITTYRQRVPMVAFSAAYLKAGATLALYASPAQAARQAAAMVRSFLAGRGLPPPQLASEFSVGINERVAHSLGLNPEAAEALADALRRQEAGR
jgi:ABC-type uncharacterized transport system substrate-binding protein